MKLLWARMAHPHQTLTVARFNPLTPADLALFKAALAGQHTMNGFRNADLVARLYRRPSHHRDEAHRRCERVSRRAAALLDCSRLPSAPL